MSRRADATRRSSLPAPTGPPPPGSRTVATDDGVRLHVEVDGDEDAPLTVVFSHGFTARLAEWELQRAALRGPGPAGALGPARARPLGAGRR